MKTPRDPQLDLLIERAIADNPDIDIALTRVQEARSQEIVVLGGMLPTIGGSSAAAAGTGTDLMKGRITPPIIAGADSRGVRHIDRMAGFDANWEIDLFGKNRGALAAARDDAEAKTEQRNAVLITVIADVARAYLNIRALQIRLQNARRNVTTAQRTVDLAMEKLQRGPPDEKDRTWGKPDGKSPDKETGSSKERATPSKDEDKDAKAEGSVSKEENKSLKKDGKSENKALSNEMSLAMAKAELEIQVARLPELAAAISAAESRLGLLLGNYAADIEASIRGPAKLPRFPITCGPGCPPTCCGGGRISARPSASWRRRPNASAWRPQTCSRPWR
jgi:outer membrane protein TolC